MSFFALITAAAAATLPTPTEIVAASPPTDWAAISPDDLVVDPARGDVFYDEVRKYWPALPDGALQAGYAGIRPKTQAPHEVAKDFVIQGPADHGLAGLVNLFGIESPGLTSALAIGAMVAEMVKPPVLKA